MLFFLGDHENQRRSPGPSWQVPEAEEVGEPQFFFDQQPCGTPLDIIKIGGTIGVRYGQLSIIFYENGDITVD